MIVSIKLWLIPAGASIDLSRLARYTACSSWTAAAAKKISTLCPSLMACAAQPSPTMHLKGSTSGLLTNLMKKFLLKIFAFGNLTGNTSQFTIII